MLLQRLLPSQAFRSVRTLASSANLKIGFVGLGNMGLPMCLNLSSKHNTVMALDVSSEAMTRARDGGVESATSLKDFSSCTIMFTMLPGCNAVNQVMPQLMDTLKYPCVLVDCSTVSPTTSRTWHEKATTQGHFFIDAPVSGGVNGAKNATLTFMVGSATQDALVTATPYLQAMGSRIISCGGPGTGSATKLCNNLALAAQMIGICEAMNLGEALGVDPSTLAMVMNTSTAKCWSSEVNNPHPNVATSMGGGGPAANDYKGGFGTNLMLKDLTLAVSAAQDAGVALPLGAMSKELYRLASLRGWGDKDFGSILQFLRGI